MDKTKLEERTKIFAVGIVRFVTDLPKSKVSEVVGYQLLKSGTSIGANYREANRAVSRNDFINKIGIVEKESAETQYWLEICQEANVGHSHERVSLLKECSELLAIFTSMGKSTKQKL
jgi:four helix bundle protein